MVAELLLMHAKSAAEFGALLRWAQLPIFAFFASSIIFLRIYFNAGRLWLAVTAFGLRLVSLFPNFLVHPNLNYQEITELRSVTLWNGERVSAAVGVASQWQFLASLSSLALLLFVVDVTLTCWRRGDRNERRRAAAIGGSFIIVVAVVGGNAALVHWGFISHPFYLFGSFLLVVLAIGNELGGEVINSTTLAGQLKESRSELRQNQRRMDLASAAAAVGAWEWDFHSDSIWMSDQARDLYGIGPSEPIDFSRFLSTLYLEDRAAVRELVMNSLGDGLRFQREYRVQRVDGDFSWVATRGRIEGGSDGERTVLRGISLDISERKLADERFREVVEAAPTGMLIMSLDGRISLINAQVEADFRYSRQELIGQSWKVLIPERFHSHHHVLRNKFTAESLTRSMAMGQDIFWRCKRKFCWISVLVPSMRR